MARKPARTKMARKAGKKSVPKRTGPKRSGPKKATGKKQNPWLKHVNAVLKELKKTNSKASLRDAIPIAKKSYKKGQADDSWNVSTSKYSTVTMPKKAKTLTLPMSSQGSYDLDAWMPGKSKKKKKGKSKKKKKGKSNKKGSRSRRR
jgi:hypothetical protein